MCVMGVSNIGEQTDRGYPPDTIMDNLQELEEETDANIRQLQIRVHRRWHCINGAAASHLQIQFACK